MSGQPKYEPWIFGQVPLSTLNALLTKKKGKKKNKKCKNNKKKHGGLLSATLAMYCSEPP